MATNNDELCDNIERFNKENFQLAITKHHEELLSYDNGNATEKIVEFIDKYCFSKEKS